jgi:predicted metal-dependent phosphoesterase TrpH
MTSIDVAADLHVHTTASDGTVGLDERVAEARERGLEALAITDHDTIGEDLTGRVTDREGLELVTGVEVRGDLFETKVELLGYFVDPTDEGLQDVLDRARRYRRERNDELLENVSEATGLEVTRETVPSDEGSVGRPHVAQYLVEAGAVESIQGAFDEYLAEDGACYVEMERVPVRQVLSAIQGAGGVASLAHPGRISADAETVAEMVSVLADAGLDAIEVQYPYGGGESRYAELDVEDAARLADEYDLLPTGGSDCHGPGSGKHRLGTVGVTSEEYAAVKECAAERRPFDG